jgi:hypothetical protein
VNECRISAKLAHAIILVYDNEIGSLANMLEGNCTMSQAQDVQNDYDSGCSNLNLPLVLDCVF